MPRAAVLDSLSVCASEAPVTGSAAEQKSLNSFIGGQVSLFLSILKGRAKLFLFSFIFSQNAKYVLV